MRSNLNELSDSHHANVEMYEDYYNKPAWWFKLRYNTQIKRKTILHLIRRGGRSIEQPKIFEIGFGSGEVLFSFPKSCELYGVELSDSAIEVVRRRADRSQYRTFQVELSDALLLNYPDDFFDIVIASHVIEHIEDDHKVMSEAYRVLKQGGDLVVLIPINENYIDPNHAHRYTPQEFIKLAQESCFRPVYTLENELLFHLVEKFYHEGYKEKWKTLGSLIAFIFHLASSFWPMGLYLLMDRLLLTFGLKPRQFGCVLRKDHFSIVPVA